MTRPWPQRVAHVILDRDGVLNVERHAPVRSIGEWSWEVGALDGLRRLGAAGVAVSVATNQAAVGRGLVAIEDVETLHRWMAAEMEDLGVRLVGVQMCPHAPDDGCGCRKPLPGLVTQAIEASGVDPAETLLVGDDHRDLLAADAAGIAATLLRTGKGRAVEATTSPDRPVFDDLSTLVRRGIERGEAR